MKIRLYNCLIAIKVFLLFHVKKKFFVFVGVAAIIGTVVVNFSANLRGESLWYFTLDNIDTLARNEGDVASCPGVPI